jgi:futalosine hydrolase
MGVDDNGSFRSIYGASLADPSEHPFTGGRILCTGPWFDLTAGLLTAVAGATVNMTSGSQPVIDRIREAWNPDIETMEGAYLAYVCARARIPWIALRAVSNIVEPRNRENWDIPFALRSLEQKMAQLLGMILRSEHSGPGRAGETNT